MRHTMQILASFFTIGWMLCIWIMVSPRATSVRPTDIAAMVFSVIAALIVWKLVEKI